MKDRRTYHRQRPAKSKVVRLLMEEEEIAALVTDESLHSMACVFVGSFPFQVGERIWWKDELGTRKESTIIRWEPIDANLTKLVVYTIET